MGIENLIAVSKHELFVERIPFLASKAALAVLSSPEAIESPDYPAKVELIYRTLFEEQSSMNLAALNKLILVGSAIEPIALEDESGTGTEIPDALIITRIVEVLTLFVPVLAIRKAQLLAEKQGGS